MWPCRAAAVPRDRQGSWAHELCRTVWWHPLASGTAADETASRRATARPVREAEERCRSPLAGRGHRTSCRREDAYQRFRWEQTRVDEWDRGSSKQCGARRRWQAKVDLCGTAREQSEFVTSRLLMVAEAVEKRRLVRGEGEVRHSAFSRCGWIVIAAGTSSEAGCSTRVPAVSRVLWHSLRLSVYTQMSSHVHSAQYSTQQLLRPSQRGNTSMHVTAESQPAPPPSQPYSSTSRSGASPGSSS